MQALELRMAGATYEHIREKIGVRSRATAYNYVMRALDSQREEPSRKVRQLEIARLDRLLVSWWPRAVGYKKGDHQIDPDIHAAKYVLELLQRRHRMLGVDAPLKVDLTGMVRELAEALGLDEEQAMEEAGVLVKQAMSQPNQN